MKGTYSHVPVAEQHHKFLYFTLTPDHFQFGTLPFYPPSLPRAFTKDMGSSRSSLAKMMLEDSTSRKLMKAPHPPRVKDSTYKLACLFAGLGFAASDRKGELPTAQLLGQLRTTISAEGQTALMLMA